MGHVVSMASTNEVQSSAGQKRPMALRAYARRRGVSAPSVLRAIERGRLARSLVYVNGVAQIGDPDLADSEWDAHTDLTKAPGYVKERAAARTAATGESATVTLPVTTVTPVGWSAVTGTLADAALAEKFWKAQFAELEYRERAGVLIDAREAEVRWADILVRVRSKLLGVPSKVKSQHPELTFDQMATIDRHIRETLEELATGGLLCQ